VSAPSGSRVAAVLVADLRARLRRPSVAALMVLSAVAAVLLIPDPGPGNGLVMIAGARALYTSPTLAFATATLLAFALSFDEVIVTTFTAGQQTTLPIWMLQELIRPRQRPVTNVVAVVIIALTFVPILIAYSLTRADEPGHR